MLRVVSTVKGKGKLERVCYLYAVLPGIAGCGLQDSSSSKEMRRTRVKESSQWQLPRRKKKMRFSDKKKKAGSREQVTSMVM